MRRNAASAVGVWLLACATLPAVASDFWEEKDFTTWSDKEVEKMLTDSPWAKQVRTIIGGSLTEGDGPSIVPPSQVNPECGGGQFDRIRRTKVTIAWSTALPIRQATVRKAIGLDAPISPESQQELETVPPVYVVTLSGLPPTLRWLATAVPAIQAETILKRKDKAPIAVKSVRVFQNKQSQLISLEFQFSKTDAITVEDGEVELITKLGSTGDLKKKFKLSDMVFAGQLAL